MISKTEYLTRQSGLANFQGLPLVVSVVVDAVGAASQFLLCFLLCLLLFLLLLLLLLLVVSVVVAAGAAASWSWFVGINASYRLVVGSLYAKDLNGLQDVRLFTDFQDLRRLSRISKDSQGFSWIFQTVHGCSMNLIEDL